jgi:hypothetical protein
MTPPVIHRVTTLDLRLQPWSWPFAEARRADIDAHFALKQREKPQLWNGRVLLGRNPDFAGDRFSASYFETDFASFLAWRDWGFPGRACSTAFGMGALRCADGAFVLGEMGRIPPMPGASIFRPARPTSTISAMARSISRQRRARNRGGNRLTPADYRPDPHWDCVVTRASDCDDQDIERRYAGRSAARADRGQSRPRSISPNFRHPSGAQRLRSHRGDAALCHGVYRAAVYSDMTSFRGDA